MAENVLHNSVFATITAPSLDEHAPCDVVIPIKEPSPPNEENPKQMSTLVKFIKSSFSSYKKKSDCHDINNTKSILSSKVSNPSNTQIMSEKAQPTFTPTNNSSNDVSCRFCQEYEPEHELVSPCLCWGTMKYIHQSCLQRWIKTQDNRFCELCKYEFQMKIITKPLIQWQKLDMTVMERRKVVCSVTFHAIALTCVIWSLYVLIERTNEEMRYGRLEWPFWTKIIVVAIGFIGGVVFMYVQCHMYVVLCRKWQAFNRIFVVQSISASDRKIAQQNAKKKTENYQRNVEIHDVVSENGNIVDGNVVSESVHLAMPGDPILRYSDGCGASQICTDINTQEGDGSNKEVAVMHPTL